MVYESSISHEQKKVFTIAAPKMKAQLEAAKDHSTDESSSASGVEPAPPWNERIATSSIIRETIKFKMNAAALGFDEVP
ncbi:hypothetical protein ACHAW5_004304 [Stephanodiscus triporus]|uniref:Uncharacterized protein n=1 Tax=Stephanodiscus triporus TaxID=2934178 RepID=A0ABD3PZQ5_9STRA